MKWVLSHFSANHHKWVLQDANDQAQFSYNLQHHSIRIKGKSNRLFFLHITGFFQKKMTLHSEYGVILGETSVSTHNNEGTISISEFRFIYRWEGNTMLLYNKSRHLLSSVTVEQIETLDKFEQFALLFSQAWIVYSNLPQKKTEDLLVA